MAGQDPGAGARAASAPGPTGDPVGDLNNAAGWSIDYFNRRAPQQYAALVALQIAAGALMGG
jgi:hypothetical protein